MCQVDSFPVYGDDNDHSRLKWMWILILNIHWEKKERTAIVFKIQLNFTRFN